MSSSLPELRNQIDSIDQSIIQALSLGRGDKDYLDSVQGLTVEDKELLRGTRLNFPQSVCALLQERMQISVDIGRVKHSERRTTMVDEVRKDQIIQFRVEWAAEELKKSVGELYEIIHDISVRVQKEFCIHEHATTR